MKRKCRIMAISSGGGHWVQLLRLRPAFAGHKVVYVTVDPGYRSQVGEAEFRTVADASRWNKLKLIQLATKVTYLLLWLRPDVIVSTGAAPGYFAIRLGKMIGARTVWLDSIANAGHMSMSGMRVRDYADLWLTQWAHVAQEDGPKFGGAVL